MEKYCYVASARRRARRLGTQGEERDGGILRRHVHSLFVLFCNLPVCYKLRLSHDVARYSRSHADLFI